MAIDLKPDEKQTGQANFQRVVGKMGNRREFMRGLLAAGTALPLSAAAYFGYNGAFGNRPVKAALIGAGDEGGVLVGEHNPNYLQFVAYSDIRPTNQARIFSGDPQGGVRKGFNYHYGANASQRIRLEEDYRQLLRDPEIEAVVIALPLNLHAQVAIEAMEAGKHVLCEKLMAWNIRDCKRMIKAANDTQRVLSIGHQRHYSMLYAHANEVVQQGVLGDIRHIRAQWHRSNVAPVLEANGQPKTERIGDRTIPVYRDSWRPAISPLDLERLRDRLGDNGFAGRWRDVNELVRWRLYRKTGGGLMAELGSHQLDACSIFLGKRHPFAVTAIGGKHFYKDDRECEDHVYCTFEFPMRENQRPGPSHDERGNALAEDIVTVTYSSISTNRFEPYGECVMGSKGTLVVEEEQKAMLYGADGTARSTSVTVAAGGAPVLSTSASGPPSNEERRAQDVGQSSLGAGLPSRGYREEMEHFAYIIRNRDQATAADRANLRPRCDGTAALGDAVMALTANIAMRDRIRIEFRPDWFDPTKEDSTPEGDYPPRQRS